MRSPGFRLIYLIPVAIILIVGGIFLALRIGGEGGRPVEGESSGLPVGKNYYVFIRSLEVAAQKSSGKNWDAVADEAPDLYYEVYWRENRIFRSATQRDQLIGNWSPLGVDTLKSIREGRIAIDSVIKAAAIRAAEGEAFELRVYDDDPVSQDVIAKLSFALSDLREGDNEFSYEASEENSITHLRLAVVNADLPLMEQVEHILNPQ